MTFNQFRTAQLPQLALIVDADEDTQELYKLFLIPRRYVVMTAGDGTEALRKAALDVPDIVVTETRLPVMDGFSLCEHLRANRRTEAVPIVVLTGDAGTLQVARARQAGADSVLIKPCLPGVLLAEIQRLRERSRALRAKADDIRRLAHEKIRRSAELVARSTVLTMRADEASGSGAHDLPSDRLPHDPDDRGEI